MCMHGFSLGAAVSSQWPKTHLRLNNESKMNPRCVVRVRVSVKGC